MKGQVHLGKFDVEFGAPLTYVPFIWCIERWYYLS